MYLVNIWYWNSWLSTCLVFEVYPNLFVQTDCDVETLEFERGSVPTNVSDSGVPSGHHHSCYCAEHLSRIADLEGRLSLLKRQAMTAMDQAGKSFGLMKKVSSLESQVSDLIAKIIHLEECDAFLIGIIESACEQLQCKLLGAPECLLMRLLVSYVLTSYSPGICLDPAAEDCRVSERSQLLRGYLRIPILFGLMLIAVAPLFFYRTTFSTSENLLMVVKNS
jgi:hypothetical protein